MAEALGERLHELEQAVRRATELIARLRAERVALEARVAEQQRELEDLRRRPGSPERERQELARLREERQEVLAQVEIILKELDQLEAL
jgi:chromosome segregation ATPase